VKLAVYLYLHSTKITSQLTSHEVTAAHENVRKN